MLAARIATELLAGAHRMSVDLKSTLDLSDEVFDALTELAAQDAPVPSPIEPSEAALYAAGQSLLMQPDPITTLAGTLELDMQRGVLYFHSESANMLERLGTLTPLRLHGIPKDQCKFPLDLRLSHAGLPNQEKAADLL